MPYQLLKESCLSCTKDNLKVLRGTFPLNHNKNIYSRISYDGSDGIQLFNASVMVKRTVFIHHPLYSPTAKDVFTLQVILIYSCHIYSLMLEAAV